MATTSMISKTVGGNARIGMLLGKQYHPIHASKRYFSSCCFRHSATPPTFGRNSLSLHKHQHVDLRQRSIAVATASQWENVLPLAMDNNVASLESLLDSSSSSSSSSSPAHPNQQSPQSEKEKVERTQNLEALIERMIFDCRFLTIMAVMGSLAGSFLCFLKGSLFVVKSFVEYFHASWQGLGTSQVIFLLVEAVDVYLMGTVMLIFGMGLYELFVSTLEVAGEAGEPCEVQGPACGSNLFGLFRLTERPKWLEIRSLDELKTKLGHVIVMILLVGMFEKSKKVPINTGLDLLCFSASILLSSGCLYLLSKLHSDEHK